ncbi:hypothetical protein GCM10022224_023110 [Nonomuraea antimicrobica]|uniref:Uncharacterized protein n=1 Tax=Nonomuraea antimicrobica TaxID=561173 RepID=A0ABP7BGA1_9ACTN
MRVKSVARVVVLSLLAPLALLATAATPAQAVPVCAPEERVCANVEGGRFVFTVKPPPTTLTFSATVNGAPAAGSLTYQMMPGYLLGWFNPAVPLVAGDVICLTFYANGLPPGPYCETAP